MSKFAPKHVVAIIASICLAAILFPIGVIAATGQLVNIVDGSNSARRAKVTADGAVRVESRTAAGSGAWNVAGSAMTSLSFQKLYQSTAPQRMVVTDITVAADSGINQATAGYAARIEVVALTRESGSSACGYSASGWSRRTLRWIDVALTETHQFTFDGSPLILPAPPNGQLNCLGFQVWVLPSNAVIFVGAAGYTFIP